MYDNINFRDLLDNAGRQDLNPSDFDQEIDDRFLESDEPQRRRKAKTERENIRFARKQKQRRQAG